MDADGRNPYRLIAVPGINMQPDLSPDGRRVVWAHFSRADTPNGWSIVVADADGSHLTTLVKAPGSAQFPRFSPDGRRILFRAAADGSGSVSAPNAFFTMSADGSNVREVPGSAELAPWRADWAPDGRHIVIDSTVGDTTGPYGHPLWILDLQDGSRHRVGSGGAPAWSPDGDHIAYAGDHGLWVMGGDGSDPHQIAGANCADPAWSTDGTHLAYRCTADGPSGDHDVWTARPDGTEARNLTRTTQFQETFPTF
jgi:TolB protein